jgi:hypothetical protein
MFARLRKFMSEAFDDSRFIIQIANGRVQVTKGKVPSGFLADLAEFVGGSKLAAGVLRGTKQETYIRLVFSPDIPPELHQRLRNIWHFHEPNFQTDVP